MSKFLRKSSPYLAAVIVITLIMGMVMMAFSGRDPWLRQSRAEAVENAPAKEIAAVDSPKGIEAAWASGAAVTG
ncbi:hypothetical protein HYR69_04730, partial [Candidatus Sumerlaeota bacterium]|nr:hypothetical protein [Candidatus Sumerlaeota bacterium]